MQTAANKQRAGSVPPSAPFPTVRWDSGGCRATFEAAGKGAAAEQGAPAVIVFARNGEGFVLGDVKGRGWCTPSGRIEAGETTIDAAMRETREEIGASLRDPRLIGHYILRYDNGTTSRLPAFVGFAEDMRALPRGSESRGVRTIALQDLPHHYYRWDDLLARVFSYALAAFT